MSTLRVTTSGGDVVRDPDRAALAHVVRDAGRSGRGSFVVLDGEPGPGPSGGSAPFVQATRLDGAAWRVEVWRVAPGSQGDRYVTYVPADDALVAVMWSWAAGTDDWQRLHWQAVTGTPLATAG